MRLPWLLAPLTILAACSSDPTGPGPGGEAQGGSPTEGGGGSGGAPVTGPASIHFFVDDRPHDPDSVEVEASIARWSDPIRIVVDDLAPGAHVRLDFSLGSFAVFTAADDGTIDLARDVPEDGSWTKADIDGPIWSAPAGDAVLFDIEVTATDADSAEELASAAIHRNSVDLDVDATPINDGTRIGVLARPANLGAGKHPAILAFGGSEGGSSTGEFFAYYLAQLGYVVLGVAYFGAPGLTPELDHVPLELLEDDLQFLASQPDVDPERIAVLGGSRGGELALLLGANFPDLVHGVVAQIPSGYLWGATTGTDEAGWTLGGVDLPYVPSSGTFPDYYIEDGVYHYESTPSFLADIDAASPEELDAATTRVENTAGPILFIAGESDALWPSCVLAQVAWDRLTAAGHDTEYGDELHCFPDAGHFIAFPPGSSTLESMSYYDPQYDAYFDTGGTPEGIAAAERTGNTALRGFLERALQ